MNFSDEMQEQEQQEQQPDDGKEMVMQQQQPRSSRQKHFTINYRRQGLIDEVLQSLNIQV